MKMNQTITEVVDWTSPQFPEARIFIIGEDTSNWALQPRFYWNSSSWDQNSTGEDEFLFQAGEESPIIPIQTGFFPIEAAIVWLKSRYEQVILHEENDTANKADMFNTVFSWGQDHFPWVERGYRISEQMCSFGTGFSDYFAEDGNYSLEDLEKQIDSYNGPDGAFYSIENYEKHDPEGAEQIRKEAFNDPQRIAWIFQGMRQWNIYKITQEYFEMIQRLRRWKTN